MKRETKVGMVVAGSFLSVVGGYLGIRWRAETQQNPAEAKSELVANEPLPTLDNWQPPKLVTVPPPQQIQQAMTKVSAPVDEVKLPPPVVVAPTPVVAAETPPTFDFNIPTTPQPVVEQPKPEPPPVVQDVKQPDPLPPPSFEFKPIEPKQEPPKVMEPPPAPIVPIDPPKEEPKPIIPPAGSASLVNDPPRPLPDPMPNLQPTAGTKPTAPKVPTNDSYLEEEYRLQAGDTFAGVSKRFYMSDKYAMSLQKYNRDYPIGSQNLKQDPPRLAAGTVVWIPPIRVLEKRYPELVTDYKPLNNNTAAAPATATTPTWTPTPTRQVGNSTKMYRVQDGGETMIEIARKRLGNPAAWNTVYQLNPSLNANANAPIPAGTILKVPGDAKD